MMVYMRMHSDLCDVRPRCGISMRQPSSFRYLPVIGRITRGCKNVRAPWPGSAAPPAAKQSSIYTCSIMPPAWIHLVYAGRIYNDMIYIRMSNAAF